MAATAVRYASGTTAPPTWWRSPQRVRLRRAIFQVHLWAGVVLALYCIVIGLSGAALVYKEQLEQRSLPPVPPGPRQVTLQEALGQIEADRPGWRVSGLQEFALDRHAVRALMARTGAAPDANYRAVLFNPNTGAVLRDRMRFSGTLGWLANLHFYLLSGHTGLLVNGWMCLGLVLLCLSGLVVWWPGQRRALHALVLRIHRRPHQRSLNLKRLNWDLHSVVGFWACAALLAVSWTGLYFCFPAPVRAVTMLIAGDRPHIAHRVDEAPPTSSVAGSLPSMTVDRAVAAAQQALPPDAPAGYMSLPLKAGAPYAVTGYYRNSLPYSRLVNLTLDPHTGAVLSRSDTTQMPRGDRIVQYFFTVHFGSFGGKGLLGSLVRAVWVLVGVAPALLAVSGLLMWWSRQLRPALRRRFAPR